MNVLIVGGGVIGLAIARELRKLGSGRITVLERGRTGRESSWAAAGMLAPSAESEIADELYILSKQSFSLYPDFVGSLREETGIDAELDTSGTLELALSRDEKSSLERRCARQRASGMNASLLSAEEVLKLEPALTADTAAAIFHACDHQVDNRKLVSALVEYSRRNAIDVVENTAARSLLWNEARVAGVRTDTTEYFADVTILATGAWTSHIELGNGAALPLIKPIKGQMIALRPRHPLLQRVVYTPKCYIVPRSDGRLLVGATVEDVGFDQRVTDNATEQLRRAAIDVLPELAGLELVEKWAGLRPVSMDGKPVIGKIPGIDRLFIATGHYRNGILLAPITAKIVAESIGNGIDSEYLNTFGPARLLEPSIRTVSLSS